MTYGDDNGKESEWNEASLKSRRLDEVQSLINFYRMNPLGVSDGKFHYESLLSCISILYGEGRSKYGETEKKEVDNLKGIAEDCLKLMPPHLPVQNSSITGNKMAFVLDHKNYEKFIDILYRFEMKVKDYNDKHGLTTKNKGPSGLF